jgi:hypothetical protein
MYLQTTKRKNRDSGIEVHMKICVLALLIQRVVEHTVGQSWFQLRQCLTSLQAAELRTATHRFFQRNEPFQKLRDVFKKLDISMPKPVLVIHPLTSEV